MNKSLITIALGLSLTACGGSEDGTQVEPVEKYVNTNTPASFSGVAAGTVDAMSDVITYKAIVADTDKGEAVFQEQFEASTKYGTFSINESGTWMYEIDAENEDVVALLIPNTLTDTITVMSADYSSSEIVITITGASLPNNAPVVTGDLDDVMANDKETVSGKLEITDEDYWQESFIAQETASSYGSIEVDEAGVWTYTLNQTEPTVVALNGEAHELSDTPRVTTYDGTVIDIAITITGTGNSEASYIGQLTGVIKNDATAPIAGNIIVSDLNTEEGNITPDSKVGEYGGTFAIDAAGDWTYTLDPTNDAVSKLADNTQTLVSSFIVGSDDGTTYEETGTTGTVAITISGPAPTVGGGITDDFDSYTATQSIDVANDAYVVSGLDGTSIAAISTDFSKSGANSLYLADNDGDKPAVSRAFLDGAASSGSVSVSVYIPEDGYNKSSYIYLGDEAGSTSGDKRFTEIVFGSSDVKFRNEKGSQITLHPYERDTWVDVTIAWDEEDITLTIDDKTYTSYDVDGVPTALLAESDLGAPKVVTLYVGNSSGVDTYTYFDDLDSPLLNVPVITDNFDAYTASQAIEVANDAYVVSGLDGTSIAEISTTISKSGANSLYLADNDGDKPAVSRAFVAGAASSGSVSVSVYIPEDGYNKSSYIYLGDEAGSTSGDKRFTEIVFGSSDVKFRNEKGSQITLHPYERDTWVDVTIAWDEEDITLTIDDKTYTSYDVDGVPTALLAESDLGAPKVVTLYVGNSSGVDTYTYFDDLNSSLLDAPIITDNYDAYTASQAIEVANDDYIVSGLDGTSIAEISTDFAKSGANSLYLADNDGDKPAVSREFTEGAADSGSVSVSVYIPEDGYNKSSYIYLGDEAGSTSGDKRFTEIVFGSSDVKFRNEKGSQITLHPYERDTWVDVTIAWDEEDITLTIDDKTYTSYDVDGVPTALLAESDLGAPKVVTLYVGNSSGVDTYTYFDDLDSRLLD